MGTSGCLEAIAGGWALVRELQHQGHAVGHIRDVVDLANRGEPEARRLIRKSGRHRQGKSSPEAVESTQPVHGRSSTATWPRAYDILVAGFREALYGNATALSTRVLQVVPTTYGDRSGVSTVVPRLILEQNPQYQLD